MDMSREKPTHWESESDSATDEDAGQSGGEQLPTPVPPITNGGGFDFN